MDEARRLTYSINVEANTSQAEANIRNITSSIGGLGSSRINIDADTSQAEANIRNVTSSLGGVHTQARSVGSAFRSSFLDGIDSGDSFSSSIRSGVGGAFTYVTGRAREFADSVTSDISSIGSKFAHPINTIRNGFGNAVQGAKDRLIDMARSAQQASTQTTALGNAAGGARGNVDGLGDAADESSEKFGRLGGVLKGVGASVAAVSAAAVAGAVAIGKQVVSAYAEYEQLIGGVDTLFGSASGKVQEYASNAFQTAGMSANNYMNLATSFSASMISSLGGDTAAAAEQVDLAITDMSDNANKMGTDMELIQNAYRGFSMQNFTMLDNLKLGYSGTQEEMQRLLDDAGKLAGKTFDITSFSDITEAIHVIQTEMGITGTTAKEAADTISGSWASTKAAMQNLFAGLGNENADIGKLVNDVTSNFSNVVKNVTPIVENLASALPEALGQAIPAISGLMPPILEAVAGIFDEVLSSIIGLLPELAPVAVDAVLMIAQTLVENVPVIADAAIQLVNGLITSVGQMLPTLIPEFVNAIVSVATSLIDNIPMLVEAGMQLLSGLAEGIMAALPQLIEQIPLIIDGIIVALTESLPLILEQGAAIIMNLVQGIVDTVPLLLEQLPVIIESLITFFTENMPLILEQGIQILTNLAMGIVQAIPALLEQLPAIITSIADTLVANMPMILETGMQLLLQLASGIIQAIPQLVAQLPQIISAIVSGIGALMGGIINIGKSIVEGIWSGISSMIGWITDKVTGFFSGIVNGVKGLLGINSPSKVFSDQVGTNMALGVGEGFEKTMGGVRKDIEGAIPTEFNLPSVNAPAVEDVTYGVNPVVSGFDPASVTGQVSQIVMVSPELLRLLSSGAGVTQVTGPEQPAPAGDEGGSGDRPQPVDIDTGDPDFPTDSGSPVTPFSPQITVNVYGEVSEETVDNMRDSLRDTVRELYDEFREEELQQMSLKNQYSF